MKERCNIKIINDDCMEVMVKTRDNEFDLAIVDPPYGIANVWSKSKRDQFFKYSGNYMNNEKPSREYINELLRVSKNQIIWGWNYFCHLLPETNSLIVWDKKRDVEKTFLSEAEFAWTSFPHPSRIYRHPWNGCKKGPETGIKKIHPFQKPVGLYTWLLEKFAKPGQKILDTHLGSGSIAIACYNLKYDLTGIEIDKDFCDAAIKRLNDHKMQMQLY